MAALRALNKPWVLSINYNRLNICIKHSRNTALTAKLNEEILLDLTANIHHDTITSTTPPLRRAAPATRRNEREGRFAACGSTASGDDSRVIIFLMCFTGHLGFVF